MTEAEIRLRLREFIVREIMRSPDYQLTDDEPLISGGLIDSFALAQVAVFAEEQFGVRVPDAELTVENLDTISQMAKRIVGEGKCRPS